MFYNLFTIIMFVFIIWSFGCIFITTVSADRNELYVAMPYGMCITALLSTFMYFRCNMATQHIFMFEFICAIVCFGILMYKNLWVKFLFISRVFMDMISTGYIRGCVKKSATPFSCKKAILSCLQSFFYGV